MFVYKQQNMLKSSLLFKKNTNFTGKLFDKKAKFSGNHFFMNPNIQGNFQICINVPLCAFNR